MSDEKIKYAPIETTGRLITSVDPTQLGKGDFQQLNNMRYTNAPGIKAVQGMSKINTVALPRPKIRSAFNFTKEQPAEQHLLVQGFDAGLTTSAVYDNTTGAPANGTFTKLFDDSTGAGVGRFSTAPSGFFCYANGVDTLLWSGAQSPCKGFIVADTDDVSARVTNLWDYSSEAGDYTGSNYALIKERYLFIASTVKINAINFTINNGYGNTTAATMKAYVWNGSTWVACTSQVDGTLVAGKTLAQSGSLTFDSTVNAAKSRYFNSTIGYWYLVDTRATGGPVDIGTQVGYCSFSAEPQPVADLWDGVPRLLVAGFIGSGSTITQDITTNIYKQDYVAGVVTSYYDINTTSPNYGTFYIGFTERLMGIYIGNTSDFLNTSASTVAVSGWDGSSWQSLSVIDYTSKGGISLGTPGVIIWSPLDLEQKKSVLGGGLYYFYKFTAATGSIVTRIDYITGIPIPLELGVYKFPTLFQNRLALCCDVNSGRNQILVSAINTNCVFNGTDSATIVVGDDSDVLAATSFFSRFSNNFYENLLVLKENGVYVVDGTDPSTWRVYNVANSYGGVAPQTLVTCDIGYATQGSTGATRNVSIWQTASNIMMWDGSILYPISLDIEDVFDQTKSYAIDPTMVSKSYGFYDEALREYHWLWASKGSTTLNNEYVFDLLNRKWFIIIRPTGLKIQLGISITDAYSEKYNYGTIDTGYVERLEHGQTFDGQDMIFTYQTGDIPLGGWMSQILIRNAKLIQKSKNNTANKTKVYIYGDGNSTPIATSTLSPKNANARITKDMTLSISPGSYVFHSFKATMTTNNEDIGFEPIGIGVLYKEVRYDT